MSDTTPSAGQLAAVAFISGVNASGSLVAESYANWNSNSPATYSFGHGGVEKWYNNASGNTISSSSAAGTPGGNVTFAFDPSVTWTTAEQQAFLASLAVWSDEANINFTQISNSTSADVLLTLSTTYATQFLSAPEFDNFDTLGGTLIADSLTPSWSDGLQATNIFNTNGDYGQLGTFGPESYGYTSLVHEAGHLLGLGHPGPYDDGVVSDANLVQGSAFDTRQWSVMSYIDPTDTTALYYNDYTVTGTDWDESAISTITTTDFGSVTNTDTSYIDYTAEPETPMILDILAAQNLYGAPTSSALDGGQVFGFDCNITDASKPLFDFTQNTDPVITLFDIGQNNTFDISGYTMDCSVNLNPGSFSSVDSLTNNVGIAFGTTIDTAVGGIEGNDTFYVNNNPNTIWAGTGSNTVVFGANSEQYSLSRHGTVITVADPSAGVTDTLIGQVATLEFADTSVQAANIPCFVRGTSIMTHAGPAEIALRAVETLRWGDRVITCRFGALASAVVIWTGHRLVRCRNHPHPDWVHPVRIRANAFDARIPARDLWLSPDHAVFADGVLIPIKHLINGRSIAQVAIDTVEYWHVELGQHSVILAEGLPVETYLDTGNRAAFQAPFRPVQIHPRFAAASTQDFCAELVVDGPRLVALKRQLADRCGGATRPPNLALSVAADWQWLVPEILAPDLWRFAVPQGTQTLRLYSPTWMPAACIAESLDRRMLGVRVFQIMINGTQLDLGSFALVGFHPVETTAEGDCRWTDGRAEIALPDDTRFVSLRLGDLVLPTTHFVTAAA